ADERGEPLCQDGMETKRPGLNRRAARAEPVLVERDLGRLDDQGMMGIAEIIVRGEIQQRQLQAIGALRPDLAPLRFEAGNLVGGDPVPNGLLAGVWKNRDLRFLTFKTGEEHVVSELVVARSPWSLPGCCSVFFGIRHYSSQG